MSTLEKRVTKLEGTGENTHRVLLAVMQDGEASRECITRHGHDPDAPGVLHIIVQGVKPVGELEA